MSTTTVTGLQTKQCAVLVDYIHDQITGAVIFLLRLEEHGPFLEHSKNWANNKTGAPIHLVLHVGLCMATSAWTERMETK